MLFPSSAMKYCFGEDNGGIGGSTGALSSLVMDSETLSSLASDTKDAMTGRGVLSSNVTSELVADGIVSSIITDSWLWS